MHLDGTGKRVTCIIRHIEVHSKGPKLEYRSGRLCSPSWVLDCWIDHALLVGAGHWNLKMPFAGNDF